MAAQRLELLNANDHAGLRLGPIHDAPPPFVQIVLDEFASAATLAPIFVTRAETTGEFYAGAILGLKPEEPPLVAREELTGVFEPLDWSRRGFHVVGEQVAIDRDDPRFADSAGEPLFGSDGGPTPALAGMAQALGRLKQGIDDTRAFIDAALAHKLLEPIEVSLKFDDGERLNLAGLYTISLDAIGELGDAEALALLRAGHLQSAYTVAQSVRQLGRLAQRRNARLTG
ncbi:multidrug transporter [Sphingomonas spermidinifaciens]|uniref:Multidrug transporter n=1 Tax=Sphingomonas spermidinifaciens TaxID=1141889 RepID=A0A2A4B2Z3_9SPHN|nr:SapC family protein [Sphingomonas spermidinifaciens]PCD02312.1 multidrug transporter [Sphingomonas spermidinifaciens]